MSALNDYLVKVKALSLVFRLIFVEMSRKALPDQDFPNAIWAKLWLIDCRSTVQGTERVLQYLARYIYRTAFSNSRLISIDHGQVTFRYRRCKERRWRTMTLAAQEFMRRFLQHVLPRSTHKVRYYGIWHPSKRQLLRRVQLLTGTSPLPVATHDEVTSQTDTPGNGSVEKPRTCPHCHQGLLVLRQTIPRKPRPPP